MLPIKVEGSLVMDDNMMDARFPGGCSNPPDVVFTMRKQLERKEVMAEMQPLLLRLRDKWTEELAADIAATLTARKLQVMEPQAKGLLSGWIYQQEDPKYVQWLKDAEVDMISVSWWEHLTIPGEEYWSSTIIMRSVLQEMDEAVKTLKLPTDQEEFFEKSLSMLKMFVGRVDWLTRKQEEFPRLKPDTLKLLMCGEYGRCSSPDY
ncbi:uncharacterized protein Triagg1_2310 [Trichoderma aggressivum f. europaeum]|uniref:Uncharacterized protein n=1 Tax=Trichoderma aggressivum f. europaeum TaxID=173218 RepID=A0AAE1M1Z2_9HYPO|nr:hypothetical protein Triagg1_2310 [Trichoderma aggressivum f. europaeum]